VEHIFERLYSFIFDIEPGRSTAEMDRPVPVAIFVVNFDKVLGLLPSIILFCKHMILMKHFSNS
jgi:hypothetical protein